MIIVVIIFGLVTSLEISGLDLLRVNYPRDLVVDMVMMIGHLLGKDHFQVQLQQYPF
jgi:hypothetical protein